MLQVMAWALHPASDNTKKLRISSRILLIENPKRLRYNDSFD